MEYTIITSENFKPTNWSGGTTSELFIFPPTSNYQQRNFLFRISTATVETDKSDFTPLPGISRKLMLLDGQITINHQNHYSKQLNKFDMDEFEGDWKTSSIGKCRDFNLMTVGKIAGELKALVVEKEKSENYNLKDNCDWLFIFVLSGIVEIDLNNKTNTINKGDLLIINKPPINKLDIKGIENSELIFSKITLLT